MTNRFGGDITFYEGTIDMGVGRGWYWSSSPDDPLPIGPFDTHAEAQKNMAIKELHGKTKRDSTDTPV